MNRNDFVLSFAVFMQFMAVTFQLIMPIIGVGDDNRAAILRILITALTYGPAAYLLFLRKWYAVIIPFGIYFFILSLHFFIFPSSHTFIESSNSITLVPIAILTAIFICNIKNFEYFKRMLLYCSRLYVLLAAIYIWAFFFFPKDEDASSYSMAFGYATLLPSMFLFAQKNIWDILMSIVLLIMVLFAGSRGPLVAIGIFYFVHYFFLPTKQKIWLSAFVSLIVVICAVYLIEYVDLGASRTIVSIMAGDASDHSTRDGLYANASRLIADSPLFGWGIGADRELIGGYCHNIFYEISIHYGLLFSMSFFLMFFVFCLRNFFCIRKLNNNGGREFFIMILIYGFVPMLVSGSYLLDFKFAILVGYLFRLVGDIVPSRRVTAYSI